MKAAFWKTARHCHAVRYRRLFASVMVGALLQAASGRIERSVQFIIHCIVPAVAMIIPIAMAFSGKCLHLLQSHASSIIM